MAARSRRVPVIVGSGAAERRSATAPREEGRSLEASWLEARRDGMMDEALLMRLDKASDEGSSEVT